MAVEIDEWQSEDAAVVRSLFIELELEDQRHYDTPERTRDEVEQRTGALSTTFTGENCILVAKDAGEVVGICWCVIYDPGTGLEAELAELYVKPEYRGQGLGERLVDRAMQLFKFRGVVLASVWTADDNAAGMHLYQKAGFRRSKQTVLTWYPSSDR
jgi:ribosomal protein S18 acetylase RimI-like enzyme